MKMVRRSLRYLALVVLIQIPVISCQDSTTCKDYVENHPTLAEDDITVRTSDIRIIKNNPLTFDWTRMIAPKEALVCFNELSFYCGAFQNETVFKEFLYRNITTFPSTGDTSPVEVPTECFCHEKPRMYIIAKLSRFLPVSNRTLEFHVDLLNNVSCAVVGQWECNRARENPLFTNLGITWDLELRTFYEVLADGVSAPMYVLDWSNIFNVPKLPVCFDTISFYYQGSSNSSNTTDYRKTETKYPRSNHDLTPMLLKDVCGNESFALIQGVFVTSQGDALFTKVVDIKENFNVEVPACPGSGPSLVTEPLESTTIRTSPGIISYSSAGPTEPLVSTTLAPTTVSQGDEEASNNFIIFLAVTVVVMLIILLLLCCLCLKMRPGDGADKPLEKSFDSGSFSESSQTPERSKDSKDRITPTPAHPPFPKKQDSFSPSPIFSPQEQKPSQSKLAPIPCNSTPHPKKELKRDKETNKWCFVDVYEDK